VDVYLWHGKLTPSLTKATALSNGFRLQKVLGGNLISHLLEKQDKYALSSIFVNDTQVQMVTANQFMRNIILQQNQTQNSPKEFDFLRNLIQNTPVDNGYAEIVPAGETFF
jgi:hypothetical protein